MASNTTTLPKLICIGGKSGSGKDTIVSILGDLYDYQRIAIADPLKQELASLFDLTREQLWGEQRNVAVPRIGRTPRKLFQEFGDFTRSIDSDIWIRKWRVRTAKLLEFSNLVVCSDLRTPEEYNVARRMGATCWYVVRPDCLGETSTANHATETTLSRMQFDFDRVIRNVGSLRDLERHVLEALA